MEAGKIIAIFKAGTKAKATKIVAFGNSDVKIGNVLKGTLSTDIKIGQNISFVDSGNTSRVLAISTTKDADLIITTGTSVYFVQTIQ